MVEEFDTFCAVDYNVITMASPMGYAPCCSATACSSATPRPRDPVTDFKKWIKHDPTLFLYFKMEQQLVSWQQSTLAQARVQDVADVLDPAYAPSLPEDKLLFEEKQKYCYAVFEQKLQTDKGKALVHENKAMLDAQAMYAVLLDHYTKLVKASLDQSQLMVYITSIKIGDGSWHGPVASFILNWQDKLREFEKLSNAKNHFSDEWKLIMLQNAIHPLAELCQVKLTADQNKVAGVVLTYDNSFKLLYSAAVNYDESFSHKKTARWSALVHDIMAADDVDPKKYDINIGVDAVLANVAARSLPGMRIPTLQWYELSLEA
jgi:hypothetical protein